MKTIKKHKAFAFLGAAFVLLIALMFIGCKQPTSSSGGSGGGGTTPTPTPGSYTVIFSVDGTPPYGTLKAKVGSTEIHTGGKVESGKTVTFTAVPDAGCKVKEWKVDGTVVTGNTTDTYTHIVTKAVTVKVSFQLLPAGEASYKVKHYQEKAEGDYPAEPTETESLSGAVGTNAAYTPKTGETYEGFTYKSSLTKVNGTVQLNGTITADNSTVVELFYERNTVNVTFNLAGGNVSGNTGSIVKTGKYGTTFTAPADPVKTDAVFKGWNPALPSPLLYPVTDAEYTAQWASFYAVNFGVNGTPPHGTLKAKVDGNEIHTGGKVEPGKTVTFTATPASGYVVDKWTITGGALQTGGTEGNGMATVKITADTTVTVTFKQASAVTIRFDESKIEVIKEYFGPIQNGATVSEGDTLSFFVKNLPFGQQVDKWKVNTKELDSHLYEVKTSDAQLDGSITVDYTVKAALPVIIRFDESKIEVIKDSFGTIQNGATVYEGDKLYLNAKNLPLGQQEDKWWVNTTVLDYNSYKVNAAHAIDEGSNKVITVTYTLKTAMPVTIKFDSSKIEVRKSGSGNIHDGDTVYEGDRLRFNALNLPSGQQVDKWRVNTKELGYNGYTVNAADAVTEGSTKVITVKYTLKTVEAVTIRFDESKIRIHKGGNYDEIHNGDTVYEGTRLDFAAVNIPPGQQFDKWKVNGNDVPHFNTYRVNVADAIDEGSNKVIRVTYTAKPGLNPVVVKFDPTFIGVSDPLSGIGLQFGQTVYEGTELFFYHYSSVQGDIDKWFVNAKEVNAQNSYTVNAADAISENGQRVIRIRLTVQDPKTLTVQFNSAEIECKIFDGTTSTSISPGYQGPAYTYVILNAKIPAGKSVKHWEINGNKIYGSEDAKWLEGQANPAFATSEGLITISVIFE